MFSAMLVSEPKPDENTGLYPSAHPITLGFNCDTRPMLHDVWSGETRARGDTSVSRVPPTRFASVAVDRREDGDV